MSLQGVDRTLDVLEGLARLGAAPLSAVSREAGLAKSAAHRILQSLCERGYASQDPGNGWYRLGPRVLTLLTAGLEGVDLRAAARPALEWLASKTRETVHLVVFEDDAVVYVDKVESPHPVRMASRIGVRGEMHSTACGKSILARLPLEELSALISRTGLNRRTAGTIVDPASLLAHLEEVRSQGFAVDDEENEADVRCVGMAVVDPDGRPLGAVSVSAPAYRLSREDVTKLVPALGEAVARIVRGLGPGRGRAAPAALSGTR